MEPFVKKIRNMEKYNCILTEEQRKKYAFFSRRNRKQEKVLILVAEKQEKGKGTVIAFRLGKLYCLMMEKQESESGLLSTGRDRTQTELLSFDAKTNRKHGP
jgi:hypothetical protein